MTSKNNSLKELHEQVSRLEATVGNYDAGSTLFVRMAEFIEELRVQRGLAKSQDKYVEERIESLTTMIKLIVEEFSGQVIFLKDEITLLKQAVF